MAAAVMGVGMLRTLVVQMVMLMGMAVIVLVDMIVGMGMGHTVVGVLVGMGVGMFVVVAVATNMIVIKMHSNTPLGFFFSYIRKQMCCQTLPRGEGGRA